MSTNKSHLLPITFITLTGISAFILLFWSMAYGPGVSPDSTVYIEIAKNLVSGNGFYAASQPVTHYPPLYSLLLAASNLVGTEMLITSRLLHASLFAINLMLVATITYTLTTHYRLLAASGAAILFLSSASIFSTHAMAWSEPPFIMFAFTGLLLLTLYITKPTLRLLIATSIIFGLAITTRYIGVVLLLPLLFGLLVLSKKPIIHKVRDAFTAVIIACIPIGVWSLRNLIVAKTATNRSFTIHLIRLWHFESLIHTLSDFILPMPIPLWIKSLHLTLLLLLFVIMLGLFYQKYRTENSINSTNMVFVSLNVVFIFSYVLFLFISISFFDAHTPLNSRILLPVFISFIIIVVLIVSSLLPSWKQPIIRLGLFFFLSLIIGLNSFYTAQKVFRIHTYGLGYTSQSWRESATISAVNALDTDIKIYSNGADALNFWTEADAVMLPYRTFPTTLQTNKQYEAQLWAMCNDLKRTGAIIVYLNSIYRQYLPDQKELEEQCDNMLINTLNDGAIYSNNFQTN